MIKIKREYLSFRELTERWKLPPDSLDLRRAVMTGLIKPCIIVRDVLSRVNLVNGAAVSVVGAGDLPVVEEVQGWVFLVCPLQLGPFEALFSVVSKVPAPTDADSLWTLTAPLTLTDLLDSAVIMLDDVESAEAAGKESRDLTTKEENTALKLISVLAADGYGWHGSGRGDTVKTITDAAEAMGLAISTNTVLRFLRRAQNEFPPSARHFCAAVGKGALSDSPASPTARLNLSSIDIGESQLNCETA